MVNDGTRDKVEGKLTEKKGELKQEVGKRTGDRSTQFEGMVDEAKGKIQQGIGAVKDRFDRDDHDKDRDHGLDKPRGGIDAGREDKLKGKVEEAEGEMKEELGKRTGDRSTQLEGTFDKLKGKVRQGVGEAKDRLDRDDDGKPGR